MAAPACLFNWAPMIYRNRGAVGLRHPPQFPGGLGLGSAVREIEALPLHHRSRSGRILGGWQLNGTIGANTGTPFTVTASGASLNAPNNSQTADQVKTDVAKLGGIGPGQPYYDPNSFRRGTGRPLRHQRLEYPASAGHVQHEPEPFPACFRFVNNGPLQFRAESYNFTNTAHFATPSANVSSGNFLVITSAAQDQRQFRLGLRLSF